jgi:hypothetical protein
MRQDILDYINNLGLGSFSLSQQLPYDNSGVPMYIRNVKTIYVDLAQYNDDTLIKTLDGNHVYNEITSVKVYFTADAKQLPANYETVISDLKGAKDATTITGANRRECLVSTSFQGDVLVTELEYRFTKLTN